MHESNSIELDHIWLIVDKDSMSSLNLLALYTCGIRQMSAIVKVSPTENLPALYFTLFSYASRPREIQCLA